MQSFLQLVAHDLYAKIGNDLSRTVLIITNKRANLFFNEFFLFNTGSRPFLQSFSMLTLCFSLLFKYPRDLLGLSCRICNSLIQSPHYNPSSSRYFFICACTSVSSASILAIFRCTSSMSTSSSSSKVSTYRGIFRLKSFSLISSKEAT